MPLIVLLAWLLLLAPNAHGANTEITMTALMEFKRRIEGGAGEKLLRSWQVNDSANSSYCEWQGVSCDTRGRGRVVGISLAGLGLQGTISPALSNLTFLEYLDLSQNAISGRIPPFPHQLQSLSLAQNLLSGSIPPSLSSLWHLKTLNLAQNNLSGVIPSELVNCTMLQALNLAQNNLSNSIPAALGALSDLQILLLWSNKLTGSIPAELGNCSNLFSIDLSLNALGGAIPQEMGAISFTGPSLARTEVPPELEGLLNLRDNSLGSNVPSALGNCSGLHFLYLNSNKLQGSIPKELGKLTNLQQLYMTNNDLTGQVSPSLGKLVFLQELLLNYNMLTGTIPESFSNLTALSTLDLGINQLVGSIPQRIGSLAQLLTLSLLFNNLSGTLPSSLANCTQLLSLQLSANRFGGPLPPFFGGLPCLSLLNVSNNDFTGHLPETFSNASAMFTLYMGDNHITGTIPSVFAKLPNLQRLDLHGNQLQGPIPAELGNARMLSELNLQGNRLEGPLPPQLGKLSFLQYLHLQGNALQGSIPEALGECHRLLDIDLSYNNFSGSIPLSLFTLPSLQFSLALSHNSLTGNIRNEVGNLQNVQVIDFSHNELHGKIPTSILECSTLQTLNLSHNKLQGQIPDVLAQLKSLVSLDLSTNSFEGQIPKNLSKLNLTAASFANNPGLCGPPLTHLCPALAKANLKKYPRSFIAIVTCGTSGFLMIICCLFVWCRKYAPLSEAKSQLRQDPFKTASALRFTADELGAATGGFSPDNLLGTGGTSKVYKATLNDGLVVAVKKFSSERNLDKAEYFFRKECETLGKLRHRNLVRILSTCCNLDMKAIVLEYMPNGSLEKLLFEIEGYQLSWGTLVDIALDVAQALVYLHHDCDVPILHCDLKPSNILLDKLYTAHVSDFGIARLRRPSDNSYSASYFRGSIGYIAPECGELAHYSVKGDVYSYGVVLLCMLTRRQPTNVLFCEEGIELPSWVRGFFPERYMDALDPSLRLAVEASSKEKEVLQVMEVALWCTAQTPKQRPTSIDVVGRLSRIKSSQQSPIFRVPSSLDQGENHLLRNSFGSP